MLYLIATPIGNLGDFSSRACQTLEQCDYLLCEDTRKSIVLLSHYGIKKPLKSFHAYNEKTFTSKVLKDLEEGKTIALLSDAGTPTISDPGSYLIALCRDHNIPVCPIPGPCAAIVALSASGLDSSRFQFFGFLPRRPGRAKKLLEEALNYPGTTIIYESPLRVVKTLKQLASLDPTRTVVLARELTKKYETFLQAPVSSLVEQLQLVNLKGECVILIAQK